MGKEAINIVLAYLSGHESLPGPSTPRTTPGHVPIAGTQEDPLRTCSIMKMGPSHAQGEVCTYLPVHIRTFPSDVDTPDHVRSEEFAWLPFAY